MKTLKELPLHIQVKMLANDQNLTDAQRKKWLKIVRTAYFKGGDDMVDAINGNVKK